ncbi:MAG: hypothetical protein DI529_04525 [Chryseobacterium sp.]|nr:MAG: hypothetical protein DI529_04525 [Chryseobacterium sp.]
MKKNVFIVLVLLIITMLMIVGLQWYFTATHYKTEQELFTQKINENFKKSIEKSFEDHRKESISSLKIYLNDSAKIAISCHWDSVDKKTVFTISDVVRKKRGQHELSMSMEKITQKIEKLTPETKKLFIDQFCQNVENDLKDGKVWYYTMNIGEFLEGTYYKSSLDRTIIKDNYRKILNENLIDEPFSFVPFKTNNNVISTNRINIAVYMPQNPVYLQAYFQNPFYFLIHRLSGVLWASFFLFLITILSFGFMFKTLLTQERLHEEKNQLITNIAHELKTPLSAIQLTTEAMKTFELNRNEQDIYLNSILKNTDDLHKLTTDFLVEARLGKTDLKYEKTDISILISEILEKFKNESVVFKFKNEENVTADIDRKIISTAVSNIIDNAIKYNNKAIKSVEINILKNHKKIEITINDNGNGIPNLYKSKIFERFFRIPNDDIHDVKGYGVGLSYVKNAMRIHHGSVEVKNNQPSGTSFVLKFPG